MNSFISWIGGKKALRKDILAQFPDSATYDRYIEVFGGAGWVLFAREKHASYEVYNDVNSQLVNLYRCVKHHPDAVQLELDGVLISREQFFDYKGQEEIRGLTEIQRAARFFVLILNSFGSDRESFGMRNRDMVSAVRYLQEVSKRLNRVIIEQKDFQNLIEVYDRERALFYLDPPYYDAEKYYPDRFNPEDHERLQNTLEKIKGRFVLSYNDCDAIRTLYQGYNIVEIDRQDNLANKTVSRRYKELIIRNY